MRVFVEATCDGNLEALIREGNPPREVLEETVAALSAEFSELCGSGGKIKLAQIYALRSKIAVYTFAKGLYLGGSEEAGKVLGVGQGDRDKMIKKIDAQIKLASVRLKEKWSVFQEQKTEKPNEEHYRELLVVISKSTGFHLTMEITASDYASYYKQFKKENDAKLRLSSKGPAR